MILEELKQGIADRLNFEETNERKALRVLRFLADAGVRFPEDNKGMNSAGISRSISLKSMLESDNATP